MIHRTLIAISIALFLTVAALGATGREVAVLVTCEDLSLDEVVALREFAPLLATGAVGVMNNRTGGVKPTENRARAILGLLETPLRDAGIRVASGARAVLTPQVAELPSGRHFVLLEAGKASQQSARELGALLSELNEGLRAHSDRYLLLLAVTAPSPAAVARQDLLTPVIAVGSDIRPGLLTSDSTHRPGLLTTHDLAPTVLAFFDIPHPARMIGAAIRVKSSAQAPRTVQLMNRNLIASYQARRPVVAGYVIATSLAIFWAAGLLIRRLVRPGLPPLARMHPVNVLLTAGMLAPAVLLLAGGLGIHTARPSAVFLAVMAPLAAFFLHRFFRDPRAVFACIGLLVAGSLCVDLAIGTPLLQSSLLSYDAVAGYRFYGIGNESTGVLLGALLLGIFAFLDSRRPVRARHVAMVAAIYILVFVLLGGPNFGADFGGMIAALPGFGYALVAARRERNKRLLVLWVSISAVFLLIVMLGVNLLFRHSHIGVMFAQTLDGPAVLLDMAQRKTDLYLWIIRALPVPLTLMVLVITGLAILAFRPVGMLRRISEAYPVLIAGFRGILIILIMAMLTNDTGMAMAGTGLIYLLPPLLQLMLMETAAPLTPAAPKACE